MGRSDIRKARRIVIRSTNWIGDAVMTTPGMEAIRSTFPDAEIVVVADPVVARLFTAHPFCDRVIVFDKKGKHKGWRGMLCFSQTLRKEKFDLAILFQNAVEAAIMALVAGIPMRAGYRTDARGILLTHGVAVGPAERRLPHAEYYLNMLKALDISGGDGRLSLSCTEAEIRRAKDILVGGMWAVINPGATYGSAKRWYPDRFAKVADLLVREFELGILIVGGPDESDICREIESYMDGHSVNMGGRTSVREMMALISLCSLMVTNDSGPMHVAAAFGVPIVAVFGPTDHTTTSPMGEKVMIVRKGAECAPCLLRSCPTDHRCMTAVTVDDVMKGVRNLLGVER